MSEKSRTRVLSDEEDRDLLRLSNVDLLKSTTAREQGRVYTSQEYADEWVEFAVKKGGFVASEDENPTGVVELLDVDVFDTRKVMETGALTVGSKYQGEDVTVAVRKTDAPTESERVEQPTQV